MAQRKPAPKNAYERLARDIPQVLAVPPRKELLRLLDYVESHSGDVVRFNHLPGAQIIGKNAQEHLCRLGLDEARAFLARLGDALDQVPTYSASTASRYLSSYVWDNLNTLFALAYCCIAESKKQAHDSLRVEAVNLALRLPRVYGLGHTIRPGWSGDQVISAGLEQPSVLSVQEAEKLLGTVDSWREQNSEWFWTTADPTKVCEPLLRMVEVQASLGSLTEPMREFLGKLYETGPQHLFPRPEQDAFNFRHEHLQLFMRLGALLGEETPLEVLLEKAKVTEWFWKSGYPLERSKSLLAMIELQASHGPLPESMRGLLRRLCSAGQRDLFDRFGNTQLFMRLGALLSEETPFEVALAWRPQWGGPSHKVAYQALEGALRVRWALWLELLREGHTPRPDEPSTSAALEPTDAWKRMAKEHVKTLGAESLRTLATRWLELFVHPTHPPASARRLGGTAFNPSVVRRCTAVITGLAWCSRRFDDPSLARTLGKLAEACFSEILDHAPAAARAGVACVHALRKMPGGHGFAQLLVLEPRVKEPRGRDAVQIGLKAAAKRWGWTEQDLLELGVPTFGLEGGRRQLTFGQYTADLIVAGPRQIEVRWSKDGESLRTEPAAVKKEFEQELAEFKGIVKDIRAQLAASAMRLERLLQSERSWPYRVWRERYLEHPLLAAVGQRLIWVFEAEGEAPRTGVWLEGALVSSSGEPQGEIAESATVRLWHPIDAHPEQVHAWRGWLHQHGVSQPFKQAYREVYLLTDAERRTGTYSNRFAWHILRRAQLRALCEQRGWIHERVTGFGPQVTSLDFPKQGYSAELWLDQIPELTEKDWSDRYVYIGTDQVRFYAKASGRKRAPLESVPRRVFSEVMRDVDLFVGVASVGNDPTWGEGARHGAREYWQGYAFGDLSPTAETRRDVLKRVLPGLQALAGRWDLRDRFLVIRGDLRTYRIHVGSANVLMEPNDQYLCIVADQSQRSEAVGRVFLPFENDATLALILSKALLLANDRQITDPTINRQITLAPA